MRFLPSASRSRLAAATLACAVAGGAVAVPLAQAADDLKDKQKKVERQIEHASDDLEHSSGQVRRADAAFAAARAKLAAAQDELASARARLIAAQARDAEMRSELAEAERKLEDARADLAAGTVAVEEQRQSVADTVAEIYQQGDQRLIAFSSLLAAQGTDDLLRRVEANRTIVDKEDGEYDRLRATEVLLRVRETQVEAAKQEVADQRAAAAEHLAAMKVLTAEAAAAKQRVDGLVASARTARAAAYAARAADRAVLRRLKEREARIKQQILAAARSARGGYRGNADGLLAAPSSGPVTSPFGYRVHPIYRYYGLHDGTDFGAPCGSPLRAVADGVVMQEYFSTVYGNRLYLNIGRVNGRFLTAVYNHATHYTVRPGERVQRGEVVGYVGSTGWSTGCHLHFSVLADGAAVDPMRYL